MSCLKMQSNNVDYYIILSHAECNENAVSLFLYGSVLAAALWVVQCVCMFHHGRNEVLGKQRRSWVLWQVFICASVDRLCYHMACKLISLDCIMATSNKCCVTLGKCRSSQGTAPCRQFCNVGKTFRMCWHLNKTFCDLFTGWRK